MCSAFGCAVTSGARRYRVCGVWDRGGVRPHTRHPAPSQLRPENAGPILYINDIPLPLLRIVLLIAYHV